jgi:hypothetical protein
VGLTGEQFNRQLHPSEIERIKALAPRLAKQSNVSDVSEAEGRLVRQALRQVDASWAELLPTDDTAARVLLLSNANGTITEGGQTYRYFLPKTNREYVDGALFSSSVTESLPTYANAVRLGDNTTQWNEAANARATNLLLVAAVPLGGEVLLAARALVASGSAALRSCFANLAYCGNALGIQVGELLAGEALPTGVMAHTGAGVATLAALAKADETAALLRIGQNASATRYLDQLINQRAARDELKNMIGREVPITQLGVIPGNSRATGDLGEQLAEQMLRRMGVADVTFLKNNSGHGVDRIIGYDPTRKEYVILEVKTSTTGSFGNLPQESPWKFLESRAARAESALGVWKESRTPHGTQASGEAISSNLERGARVVGYKLEIAIPQTGTVGTAVATVKSWH